MLWLFIPYVNRDNEEAVNGVSDRDLEWESV
jgi:hypothetical protein